LVKKRLRTIIVVILLVLTVGLAGTAIYVGYRLQEEESQAPEPSEAAGYETVIGCGANDDPPCTGRTGVKDAYFCPFTYTQTFTGDGTCEPGTSSGWIISVDPATFDAGTWKECKIGPNPCAPDSGYDAYCICGEPKICPYKSTEVKLQKTPGGPVSDTITDLACGDQFTVGIFHNNELTKFARDMTVTVTGPDGEVIKTIS